MTQLKTKAAAPFAALLLATSLTPAFLVPEILDEERARVYTSRLVVDSDPDRQKPVGTPPVMIHLTEGLEAQAGMGLEMTVLADKPVDIEIVGHYTSNQPFLFSRRAGGPELRRVRWEIPSPDRLTSFTLNVRSAEPAEAHFEFFEIRNLEPLTDGFRLESFIDQPLIVTRAADPVREDILDLFVLVPEFFKSRLSGGRARVEVSDSAGEKVSVYLQPELAQSREDAHHNRVDIQVPLPEGWQGPLVARLITQGSPGEDQLLPSIRIETAGPAGGHYEVAGRSIENFTAMVHNRELILYTVLAEEGAVRTRTGVPLPTTEVFLTAGDGIQWATEETVIRSRRDNEWMMGGPSALAVAKFGEYIHMVFTLTGLNGVEAIGTAHGIDSLRLAPSPRNPIWTPEPRANGVPSGWRGNGLINFNGHFLLLGLEEFRPGQVRPRFLLSEFPWRWMDLGVQDLTVDVETATSLSVYTRNGIPQIVFSPEAVSLVGEHPLWGWRPKELVDAPQWQSLQLLDWKGETWWFGLNQRNGRGVVEWQPAGAGDVGARQ